MAIFFLLVFILLILLYLYATRNFNYWKKLGVPYEKPVPFLGNKTLMLFKQCMGTYLQNLYEKSDAALMGFFILDKPLLIVKDPDMIKHILIKDFQFFINRTITNNVNADPIGSQMLFLLKRPYWRYVRQKMTVTFTSGKMKLMFPLIAEVGKDLVQYLEKGNGEPTDAKVLAMQFTTDVISSCAFAAKGMSFETEESDFRKISKNILKFTWLRGIQSTCYFIAPTLVRLFNMKLLEPKSANYLRDVFWEAVKLRKQIKNKRNDLIDILLEIKDTEIVDDDLKFEGDMVVAQAAQFFIAGYETSGLTICFALYELALQPSIQSRLRKEILEVCEKYNGVTYDAVQDMKYLEMVIQETLRKYPVLPFLDREAAVDYKLPGSEITIRKGTPIFISLRGLQHDPQFYPEPDKFDPERFTPENKASRHTCVYLPFGEGPRNCIGSRFGLLSTKTAVLTVVANFEIRTVEGTPSNIEFDRRSFLLTPLVPVLLQFKKIN